MEEYEQYNPRHAIEIDKMYCVDKLIGKWNDVGPNQKFLPGGRYFIIPGRNLQMLVKLENDYNNKQKTYKVNKKRNVCFVNSLTDRQAIIKQYEKIFYSRSYKLKSEPSFRNLCIRPRNKRYLNRRSFSYLVVKQLQCLKCNNVCVYDALKIFYLMDDKCVDEVNALADKE
nr:LEF-2 [Darna trima granulovirus]